MPTRVALNTTTEAQVISADEFLDWLEPGMHADLVNGEIFMHSPVSIRHARLLDFVHRLVVGFVEERPITIQSGQGLGEVFRETVAVRLASRNVFLPDLMFYRTERLHLVGDTFVEGPPDLVVEVLSERTAHRDVGDKFVEYEQQGVREYWVLDPNTLAHSFFARAKDIFEEYARGGPEVASTVLPGLVLKRSWLDPSALPKVADCLGWVRARG
jgi:Uma2 family endonuclease